MHYRVCYISPNAHLGGAEKVIEQCITHHSENFKPSVIFCRPGPLVDKWKSLGVPCHVLPFFRLRHPLEFLRSLKELRSYLKLENISLINSHMGYGHILGGAAGFLNRTPEVWFQHGPIGVLDTMASTFPSKVILTNSQFLKEQQQKISFLKNIRVVGCPIRLPNIDIEQLNKTKNDFKKKYDWPDETFILIHVARMDSWKGQREFISIVENLSKEDSRVRGVLFGDASIGSEDYLHSIKTTVMARGLSEIIKFEGFIEDPINIYGIGDLLIHTPIEPEPFGLVILEAGSYGLPTVSWADGGSRDFFDNENFHLSFKTNDSSGMAKSIKALMTNSRLYIEQGQRARAVAAQYEAGAWVKRLEEIYTQYCLA